jgi:magnesium-transporting ATPase (P-type)
MSTNTSERATLIAYQLDVSGVMKDLGTSERGLSSSEVSKRLTEYGPNQLAEEAPVSR